MKLKDDNGLFKKMGEDKTLEAFRNLLKAVQENKQMLPEDVPNDIDQYIRGKMGEYVFAEYPDIRNAGKDPKTFN